jgi:rod shape determining protein RodA
VTDWTPRSPAYRPQPRTAAVLGRESALRSMDWTLNVAVLTLCGLGSLLVWSATRPTSGDAVLKKHLITIAVGIVLGAVVTRIDFRNLRSWAPIVFVVACLGLAAALVPGIGSQQYGTRGWIPLAAGFYLQPSEFAKLAVVVLLAGMLSEKRDLEYAPRSSDVIKSLLVVGVPMGLIMLQPDLGTALVFIVVVLGAIAVSGASSRWLVLVVLGVFLAAILAVQLHLLKPYQVNRLTSFTKPNQTTQDAGFNAHQARLAIGSGGLTGKGLFHGAQTNGGFVYASSNDFIFAVAGEELGFVGGAVIIGLTGVVMLRGLRIATRSEDRFGRLVATGVVCWFAFQSFENIGMNLGIMPVTGIPLPFVSYGGSAMFANLVAVGLLQSIHRENQAT